MGRAADKRQDKRQQQRWGRRYFDEDFAERWGDANEEYQRDLLTYFGAERGDDWEEVEERYNAAATELRDARAAVEELIEAVPFDEVAPPEMEGPEPRGGIDGALGWSGRSFMVQTAVLHHERAFLPWRLEADEED